MVVMRCQRFLIFCGCVAAFGCSDAPSIRGVVLYSRGYEILPASSIAVYALPARNQIDRELTALCEGDSILNASGRMETPIGPVRIHAEGVELNASVESPGSGRRGKSDAAVKPTPWQIRDAHAAFQVRMDSLVRRAAIASARTSETGQYELRLQRWDSIELFAVSVVDDRGTTLVWRDRVVGVGIHDLRNPVRRMHYIYCGEP
ncbi:MAG: hypothetical protein ACREBE_05245 [bacterium]